MAQSIYEQSVDRAVEKLRQAMLTAAPIPAYSERAKHRAAVSARQGAQIINTAVDGCYALWLAEVEGWCGSLTKSEHDDADDFVSNAAEEFLLPALSALADRLKRGLPTQIAPLRLRAPLRPPDGPHLSTWRPVMADRIEDGGPAFPFAFRDTEGHPLEHRAFGMSLRDAIAISVMPTLLANLYAASAVSGIPYAVSVYVVAADGAYEAADAMLAARSRQMGVNVGGEA